MPSSIPSFERKADTGLLILRIGLGSMLMAHGLPKAFGGPDGWNAIGSAMSIFGISRAYWAWGLVASAVEILGGLSLIAGLFTSMWCFLLTIVMVVATCFHLSKGDDFILWSHPIELALVFASLILIGPGIYSIDGIRWKTKLDIMDRWRKHRTSADAASNNRMGNPVSVKKPGSGEIRSSYSGIGSIGGQKHYSERRWVMGDEDEE